MSISREEVEKVAKLSRLLLNEDELEMMTDQLSQVLDYFDIVSELDTEDVEPMAHAIELSNVFREDVVEPSLSVEEALANAPHQDGECFLVPAVLGE